MLLAERFRLEEPAGRGGMGEVWRACDERLGRTVAVKLLADCATDDPVAVARFEREARIAARLHHPHVVGVYDFGVDGGRCFLVMEYVDGGTLADELRRSGPLRLDRFAVLAGQTADGLAAAHGQGIVHRDVKPSNVLVDGDGLVKIADFGIARLHSTQTATDTTVAGQVRGTSMYVAPETVLGRPTTSAGDVYSLGCSLYEMLTGRPPFQAETPLAVLWQHVERPFTPLARLRPEAPADLRAYVEAMLAKDPAQRPAAADVAACFDGGAWQGAPLPASAADFGVPLGVSPFAADVTAPTLAAPAPPSPALRRRHRAGRSRRALIGAAVTASVLTAAGVVLATSSADGGPAAPGHAVTSPSAPGHRGTAAPRGQAQQADTSKGGAAAPASRKVAPPAATPSRPGASPSADAPAATGGPAAGPTDPAGATTTAPTAAPPSAPAGTTPPAAGNSAPPPPPPTTEQVPSDAPTGTDSAPPADETPAA
ncbi:protein kinase [Streptomyces sp. V4-01]|uniref:non-specific serine/threonine protein kinase n=1 Tax=Actinacidiphila polyblastidii TaxID=3110430 RepID=A0ABU7P3V5_9ACTN|nr:protein kinase [Streptomyces sp. V4-01]